MFDLIVSDIMMPGIDGFEFATNIRELNENIPILFIAPSKSVVNVLNIILKIYKYCGYICNISSYVE